MALVARLGLPSAIHSASAPPHEVTLAEAPVAARCIADRPAHLIGDNAVDRDPLDVTLAEQGMELSAPHRSKRGNKTHDGRRVPAGWRR